MSVVRNDLRGSAAVAFQNASEVVTVTERQIFWSKYQCNLPKATPGTDTEQQCGKSYRCHQSRA